MFRKSLKHALIAVAAVVAGSIGGCIGAVVTWPFWGWFEKTTGIESLGHSGPDDWVFEFMIGVGTAIVFAALEWYFAEARRVSRSGGAVPTRWSD